MSIADNKPLRPIIKDLPLGDAGKTKGTHRTTTPEEHKRMADKVFEAQDPMCIFLDTWCVKTVSFRKNWTTQETLDFLALPESMDAIDKRSAEVTKIYSRMPKEFYLQLIMQKIARIHEKTTATEMKALLDGFMNWHKEAAPPSNREFSAALLEQLSPDTE